MKKLLRILTVHSAKELLRYKSFFLLIFILMLADRVIHRYVKAPDKSLIVPHGLGLEPQTADFIFGQLPGKLAQWLFTPRFLVIVVVLFLLKQVISLWPSSDMRRMHRSERGRFGIFEALLALRWYQVAWDALAVATLCGVMAAWFALAYLLGLSFWERGLAIPGLLSAAGVAFSALPLAMAGFSYSSKLAVIRNGTFGARFRLFLYLFLHWRLLWTSWLFFSVRIVVEAVFVAIIPAGALLFMENFWLRITIATLSATPVYSYLKMASFKFFLEVYADYALVRDEYGSYYDRLR